MAEQENAALIQTILDAFKRGDIPTILNHCTDDCVYYNEGPAVIPYAGRKVGRPGMTDYFRALVGTQSDINLIIDRLIAQDDMVVALGRYQAIVKATNRPIDSNVALTWKITNGKVKNFTAFSNTAAIAASYANSAAATV